MKKTVRYMFLLFLCFLLLIFASCVYKYEYTVFTRKSAEQNVTAPKDPWPEPTSTEPTYIGSAEELKNIAYNGYYILTSDIDLGGEEWEPLGEDWRNDSFTGIFDGNGFVISNFKITKKRNHSGLFIQNRGQIKNLGVENFEIAFGSVNNVIYAGGIVGVNYSGIIENCYAKGSISCYTTYELCSVGGISGYSRTAEIKNCYSDVDISAKTDYGGIYTGGIVALNRDSLVENCYSLGSVSGRSRDGEYDITVGGIVGFNANTGEIINCYAVGNIEAISQMTTEFVGGIAGLNYTGSTVSNCYISSDQTIKSNDPPNDEGVKVGLEVLLTEEFLKNKLLFDEEIWELSDGKHPTIKQKKRVDYSMILR